MPPPFSITSRHSGTWPDAPSLEVERLISGHALASRSAQISPRHANVALRRPRDVGPHISHAVGQTIARSSCGTFDTLSLSIIALLLGTPAFNFNYAMAYPGWILWLYISYSTRRAHHRLPPVGLAFTQLLHHDGSCRTA
ncbi:hypothetical protein BDW22DRAFT_1100707 [Trametopsis cervina]|nr:hypothetical protein BDW22DRAFT_1100707 [Trametopsis cervina]